MSLSEPNRVVQVAVRELGGSPDCTTSRAGLPPVGTADHDGRPDAVLSPCDLWEGRVTHNGYGAHGHGLAHKVAWEAEHGPVPDGYELHHRCEVKLCRRVSHLECLTQHEHKLRHGKVEPEDVLRAIREFSDRYGRLPRARDWNPTQARNQGRPDLAERFRADGCWPQFRTVQRIFGTWNAAIAAAGFAPTPATKERAA